MKKKKSRNDCRQNRWWERKKKVSFANDVKLKMLHADLLPSMEAGMTCTINGEIFFSFTKNMWIGYLGTLCHISNDDSGLYDVTNINKHVQVS